MNCATRKLNSLTMFFPFYNEEANIERVTQNALDVAERVAEQVEIILVNDGSRDQTGAIADQLAEQHVAVKAVHNNPNLGYGGAVRRGLSESKMDWVFFSDGDGQFDLDELPKLVELLDSCDMPVGYRIDRADPFIRKANAFCWGTLVRALFGIKVRDIDCAFKLIPRSLLDATIFESNGALISTELLAKATYAGLRIGEVGVHHYPRTAGEQTGANLRVIAKAFKELFQLHSRIRAEKVPNLSHTATA